MSARENRPTEGAVHEIPAPASTHSVADGSDITPEWLDGYEHGLIHGDPIGYQRAQDDFHARAEVSGAVAAQMAKLGSFADLCEARGEPARAARQRQILADREI